MAEATRNLHMAIAVDWDVKNQNKQTSADVFELKPLKNAEGLAHPLRNGLELF